MREVTSDKDKKSGVEGSRREGLREKGRKRGCESIEMHGLPLIHPTDGFPSSTALGG